MKRIIFIVLSGLAPLLGFGQDYLVLDGYIDQAHARMYLTVSQDKSEDMSGYEGYYAYPAQDIPIQLRLKEYAGEKLDLISYGKYSPLGDETDDIIFSGTLKENVYSGLWTDGERKLVFKLSEANPATFTKMTHFKNAITVPVELDDPEIFVEGNYDFDWYLPEDEDIKFGLIEAMEIVGFTDFYSFTHTVLSEFELDYMETILEMVEELDEEDAMYTSSWNHFHNISLKPILDNAKYLIMEYNAYDYTGGAHGYYYSLYYTYNKQKGKWLKLDDIFNMREMVAIELLIDQELRKQYNISPEGSLMEAENSIFTAERAYFSENITLNKQGITFHYSIYELTPYVYGNFQLTIPYEKLKPFLNSDFSY